MLQIQFLIKILRTYKIQWFNIQGIFYINYLLDKNNFDNEIYVRLKNNHKSENNTVFYKEKKWINKGENTINLFVSYLIEKLHKVTKNTYEKNLILPFMLEYHFFEEKRLIEKVKGK